MLICSFRQLNSPWGVSESSTLVMPGFTAIHLQLNLTDLILIMGENIICCFRIKLHVQNCHQIYAVYLYRFCIYVPKRSQRPKRYYLSSALNLFVSSFFKTFHQVYLHVFLMVHFCSEKHLSCLLSLMESC